MIKLPISQFPAGLAYLAAPYSHPSKEIVAQRMELLEKVDAKLTAAGLFTVTPLSKHYILRHDNKVGSDWDYWKEYSKVLMRACYCVIVIRMDGWGSSVGVQDEIKLAADRGLKVFYIDPADLDL